MWATSVIFKNCPQKTFTQIRPNLVTLFFNKRIWSPWWKRASDNNAITKFSSPTKASTSIIALFRWGRCTVALLSVYGSVTGGFCGKIAQWPTKIAQNVAQPVSVDFLT
jgi:hypothetical protein